MDEQPPFLTAAKAVRRLKLLLPGHGALLPGLLPVDSAAAAASLPPSGSDGLLAAALLPEPAPGPGPGVGWQQERDVLAEVAVSMSTLQVLKLPAGTIVTVAAVSRPEVAPHLARLLALPDRPSSGAQQAAAAVAAAHSSSPAPAAAPAEGVAYLAPSLAFNLGLALHLWPLLHQGAASSSGTSGSSAGSGGSAGGGGGSTDGWAAGCERVRIQRYCQRHCQEPAQQQQDRQHDRQWHCLAQPGQEAAAVPVAAEAHVAVLRLPLTAVLQPPRPPGSADGDPEHGSTGSGGTTEAAAVDAAPPPATASDDAVAALQQWFLQARRVVHAGDVLAVPKLLPGGGGGGGALVPQLLPRLLAPAQPAAASVAPATPELLYFRVAELVVPPQLAAAAEAAGGAAAVDVGSTAVKLVGSCSSGLPVGLPHYLAAAAAALGRPSSGSSGSSSSSPGGGSGTWALGWHAGAPAACLPLLPAVGPVLPAWRQLAELLASVLHPAAAHVPLRLAVLLHGPSGSGKRTAAAAASAAVGCHLVSLSSHDIKAAAGAAERHTFEGLRAAFAAAANYRPAVLLLRQLSVLGDGSSHGGSGSASTHSYAARLGSVLAECIRAHSSSGGSEEGRGQERAQQGLFPAPLVLVACTASADDLPPALRRCFTHELCVTAPDQQQRQHLLHGSLGCVAAGPDLAAPARAGEAAPVAGVRSIGAAEAAPAAGAAALHGSSLEDTARHTAGLLPRELRAVAADAAAAAALQVLPAASVLAAAARGSPEDGGAAPPGGSLESGAGRYTAAAAQPPALLTGRHLAGAVDAVRQRTATDIGAPRIPSVHWEDVGGLDGVKRDILDTVELPLKHPELFAGGLRRRSGVLLYGPPGTGKTLVAKAVATECSISFLSVKGPELINMYVGESERQIREVFARARRARPCVVFFDELDSLAPARGRGSDSGGVMDRVVSQLLAEIDGAQGTAGPDGGGVFLIGATNRPDLLDAALLRPGRLDKLLYVGIASDAPSRLQVLRALTRRFRLDPGVDLAAVAARCADRFTGADLYALCSDAWMSALKRAIAAQEAAQAQAQAQQEELEQPGGSGGGGGEGGEVVVLQRDLVEAAASLQPSLSAEEVAKYERLRDQYNSQQRGGQGAA